MPALTATEKSTECESLAVKVHAYVSEASIQSHSTNRDLHGLPEYATELAGLNDRTTLLALGREVDRWLREVHEPSEALLLIARMRSRGVRESELPVLASAKRLLAVVTRGSIRSKSEAVLVQSILANEQLAKLLGARAIELNAALAKWHIGRACR